MGSLNQDDACGNGELTAQQLADQLGVSRRTIFYLRRNAGGPRGTGVNEWRDFLEARSSCTDSGKMDSALPEELQKTKHRLLRAQAGKEEAVCRLKELELEQQTKNLVPMADAKEAVRRVLEPLRNLLDAMPQAVAAQVNPANPILAEEAMREGFDKIFAMMEKELGNSEGSEHSK